MPEVLSVKDLVTKFYTDTDKIYAVNGVSFHVDEGETLGIVGESGCGKSVSVLSMLRLIAMPPGRIESGEAIFQGKDLLKMTSEEIRQVRGAQIGMVFQDPMTSLNPVLNIETQVAESLLLHKNMTKKQARERVIELLTLVGIPSPAKRLADYPHQFSGGMRQRVMIAMALACNPSLLIADEPTTALDVTIQAQFIELVKRLRAELGMAIIWITHDLGIMAGIAHRIVVMYAGFIVEHAPVKELYAQPIHPYEAECLAADNVKGNPVHGFDFAYLPQKNAAPDGEVDLEPVHPEEDVGGNVGRCLWLIRHARGFPLSISHQQATVWLSAT